MLINVTADTKFVDIVFGGCAICPHFMNKGPEGSSQLRLPVGSRLLASLSLEEMLLMTNNSMRVKSAEKMEPANLMLELHAVGKRIIKLA